MEMFLAGAIVGIVVSNVWNALLGRGPRKLPPPDEELPRLPPTRKKRRS